MRSIERRFLDLQEKRPELSSLINLGTALKGQQFSAGMIHRWFNRLVEKNDYERGDKRAILKHLVELSCPEESRKEAINATQRSKNGRP